MSKDYIMKMEELLNQAKTMKRDDLKDVIEFLGGKIKEEIKDKKIHKIIDDIDNNGSDEILMNELDNYIDGYISGKYFKEEDNNEN